jgi:hypothetical protein
MKGKRIRKAPAEKKRLSLARDRRNTYGESDKGSRRIISLRKQQGQMALRRVVAQQLRAPKHADESVIEDTAANVADAHAKKRRKLFRKAPDTPLGVVLETKRKRGLVRPADASDPAEKRHRLKLVRASAIAAFSKSSPLLEASDVTWGESGFSSTRMGRRFRLDVHLKHVPTGVEVSVSSEQEGGHSRGQAQNKKSELYQLGLRKLEDQVRKKLRDARRQESTQPRR